MFPVQITIKDVPHSPTIEEAIHKRANKLAAYFDHISSCRVVIEMTQKHKHQGKLYNVRIDTTVPGKELVVTHKQDEDVYVAIRDAFNALQRQMESYVDKLKGHVKIHQHQDNE